MADSQAITHTFFLNALAQVLARARDRLFHAFEKAGSLLFVQTAKQGLNHKDANC